MPHIGWKVDQAQRKVHFEVRQDIALTPIRFALPFAMIKGFAAQILAAEAEREAGANQRVEPRKVVVPKIIPP